MHRHLACLALVDLVVLADHLKMWSPLKRVLQLFIQMIQEGFSSEHTKFRDEAVQLVVKSLCKSTDNLYI